MNGAEPFVAQETDGPDAEHVLKGAVQPAARYAKGGTKFRYMHRARAGIGEIVLDIVHEPQRRRQRARPVRWQRPEDRRGDTIDDGAFPEIGGRFRQNILKLCEAGDDLRQSACRHRRDGRIGAITILLAPGRGIAQACFAGEHGRDIGQIEAQRRV